MKTIYKGLGTISEAALSPGLQLAIVPDESATETQIQHQYGNRVVKKKVAGKGLIYRRPHNLGQCSFSLTSTENRSRVHSRLWAAL
jgi:hypothetical protein